mmetsp:Transcript_17965/g.39025  ORF Transcript_17965/g.39025 Transcript_17965/m.39025 type:complete len:95 (-) Transcript_17965:151-435(-)
MLLRMLVWFEGEEEWTDCISLLVVVEYTDHMRFAEARLIKNSSEKATWQGNDSTSNDVLGRLDIILRFGPRPVLIVISQGFNRKSRHFVSELSK